MSKAAKIDTKGRLRIPTDSLSRLGNCIHFFITSGDGRSARVYPLRIWNEIEKHLVGTRPANIYTQNLLVRTKYFGQAVTIDKQGRLLIPVVLRQAADIRGEVDVLRYSKYLEIWNHMSFLKSLKRRSVTKRDEVKMNRMLSN